MQPVSLLIAILTCLSAAAMNHNKCPQPTSEAVEEALIEMLPSPIDGDIVLVETHYLCLAVRASKMYDSMSIAAKYTVNDVTSLAQFDFVCSSGSMWQPRTGSLNTTITMELFSIATSMMCYQCNYDGSGGRRKPLVHDSTTHCISCSENCKSQGNGYCHSPSDYSCCPYFDKDGECVDECSNCTACPGNWGGETCTECLLTCSNGGTPDMDTCTECVCRDGYTSATCDDDIDECQVDGDICGKNGHCVNTHGSYVCECDSGYSGANCETDIDECEFEVCTNNGICQNTEGSYECLCDIHFTGEDCDEHKCSCENGGECVLKNGSFFCDCTGTGYTGILCTDDIDDCKDTPCIHGSCINNDGGYSCICDTGYYGLNCSEEEEKCKINTCLHGGICYNVSDKNVCQCINGWSGEMCNICEFEILEEDCVDFNNNALNQEKNNNSILIAVIIAIVSVIMFVILGSLSVIYCYWLRTRMHNATKKESIWSGMKVIDNPLFINPKELL